MLDAWAVFDAGGNLLATHEGSVEEATEAAVRVAPRDATVFLDGDRVEYETAVEDGELAIAANISSVVVPEHAPFSEWPAFAARALGIAPLTMRAMKKASAGVSEALDALEVAGELEGLGKAWVGKSQWYCEKAMLGGNYKMDLTSTYEKNVIVQGLSMAPHKQAIFRRVHPTGPSPKNAKTVCLGSTPECRASCLVMSGQNSIGEEKHRIKAAKTGWLLKQPLLFARLLHSGICVHRGVTLCRSKSLAVRLNVYSDVPWEIIWPDLFETFSDIQFYDYTKVPGRVTPENYDITFSYSGRNQEHVLYEIERGHRVAVVFGLGVGMSFPQTWNGLRVVDGARSDFRPSDPPDVCVGLRYRPPIGIYFKVRPKKTDVFVVPCEVLDSGMVVVADVPRHKFALGEAASQTENDVLEAELEARGA